MSMKLIKKGAEGDIFLTSWNKKKAILKARKKKDYRNATLDQRLRKQRTIRECEIISEVKSFGVSTPLIYNMDIKKIMDIEHINDARRVLKFLRFYRHILILLSIMHLMLNLVILCLIN